MKRNLVRVGICSLLVFSAMPMVVAFAADGAPELPPTAKKQTAKQIVALFDGKTYSWTSWNKPEVRKGTSKYDFKKWVTSGTYPKDGVQTPYENDPIRMKGDRICYSINGSNCVYVYFDGTTIYEINDKKKVGTIYIK